ncbi:hypothetical protein P4524_07065, partial [Geobacillus stearothermophilus]|nr:hypothetical protein [Geobacillus stearothermophilus]
FGLDTFTIQENSHFLYPLFSLCTPIFNDQVQLVVKSQFTFTIAFSDSERERFFEGKKKNSNRHG